MADPRPGETPSKPASASSASVNCNSEVLFPHSRAMRPRCPSNACSMFPTNW